MGALMMDDLAAALSWSGIDVTLSMFTISSKPISLPHLSINSAPHEVKTHELSVPAGIMNGLRLFEHDLIWPAVPDGLAGIVTRCLSVSLEQGALVAWFALEGSFSFDYLLHPDVAHQIYAVAASGTISLALADDIRHSQSWKHLLSGLRGQLQLADG